MRGGERNSSGFSSGSGSGSGLALQFGLSWGNGFLPDRSSRSHDPVVPPQLDDNLKSEACEIIPPPVRLPLLANDLPFHGQVLISGANSRLRLFRIEPLAAGTSAISAAVALARRYGYGDRGSSVVTRGAKLKVRLKKNIHVLKSLTK